jgi:hypothetical protein
LFGLWLPDSPKFEALILTAVDTFRFANRLRAAECSAPGYWAVGGRQAGAGAETGTERDIRQARTLFLKLSLADRRAALASLIE